MRTVLEMSREGGGGGTEGRRDGGTESKIETKANLAAQGGEGEGGEETKEVAQGRRDGSMRGYSEKR